MAWRHISFPAVTVLALASPVMAADDLLDAPEVSIASASQPSGSFYLRGDIGYAGWTEEGDPSLLLSDPGAGSDERVGFDGARFGSPVSGSAGIGYQINDMVRADATAEYFSARFGASGTSIQPCDGETAGTTCAGSARADYKALGFMANGYVDLGTFAGFTPYLGAGLGATQLRFSSASLDASCVAGAAACSGAGASTYTFGRESSWRFTYALMVGVSYDVSEKLKLDLGYRYSRIGDGKMFGDSDARANDDGLDRHEIRAGLRFSFW